MPVQVLGLSDRPGRRRAAWGEGLATARTLARRGPSASPLGHTRSPRRRRAPSWRTLRADPARRDGHLNLVLKADVQGSLEASRESAQARARDVKLSFVHRGSAASPRTTCSSPGVNATIIGFNVRPDRRAREMARPPTSRSVPTRSFTSSWRTSKRHARHARPEFEEVVTGDAEVREVYRIPASGRWPVDGASTARSRAARRSGSCERGPSSEGTITSLRRFKDDAREVQAGFECGIGLSDYQDLRSATSSRPSRSARSRGPDVEDTVSADDGTPRARAGRPPMPAPSG